MRDQTNYSAPHPSFNPGGLSNEAGERPLQSLQVVKASEIPRESGRLRWLVSYADMVTLLFALFLVLYSLSQTHPEVIQRLVRALPAASKPTPVSTSTPQTLPALKNELAGAYLSSKRSLILKDIDAKEKLFAELQATLAGELLGVAEVHNERRGVVVALLDTPLLFESGQAELKASGREILGKLVPISLRANLPMRVEGHTDNVPIHTGIYPSNWELSVMRAAWVTRALVDLGISPEKISAMGYGPTHPRYPNSDSEGRSRNRRVEIVFLFENIENALNR